MRDHSIATPFETSLSYLLKDVQLVLSRTNTATFFNDYQSLSVRFIQVISGFLNKLTQYIPDSFYNKFDAIVDEFDKAIRKNKRQVFRQSKQPYDDSNYIQQTSDQIQVFLNKYRNYANISEQKSKLHRKSVENLQSYIQSRQSKQKQIKNIIGYAQNNQSFSGQKMSWKNKQRQKVNAKIGPDLVNNNYEDAEVQTEVQLCQVVQLKFRNTCNTVANQSEYQDILKNRNKKKAGIVNKNNKNFRKSLDLNFIAVSREKAVSHSKSKSSKNFNQLKTRSSILRRLQIQPQNKNSKRDFKNHEANSTQSRIRISIANGQTQNNKIHKKTKSSNCFNEIYSLQSQTDFISNNLIRQTSTKIFDSIRQSSSNIASRLVVQDLQFDRFQGIQQQELDFSSQNIIEKKIQKKYSNIEIANQNRTSLKTEISQLNQNKNENQKDNHKKVEARKLITKGPLKILVNQSNEIKIRNSYKVQKPVNNQKNRNKQRNSFGISMQIVNVIKKGQQQNVRNKLPLA